MKLLALPSGAATLTAPARIKLLTIVAASLALQPAPGDITPQQATAAFKSVIAQSMKQLKGGLQVARQAFLADIQAYETNVKQGLDVLEQTGNFIPECTAFQKSVQDTTNGAMAEIIEGAVDALDALSSGLPLNGGFPKDFYSGAGGALDKARSDVKRQVDQLYKSISGRLRKTVKVLEQNDASLTVDLRPPRYHDDHRFSEDGSAVFINRYGLDLVVAVNRTALAEDGRLWTGGTAYSALGEVSVLVTGPESDSGTAPVSSARWALFLTDAGSFFVKGNYSLSVTAESDIGGVGVPFSFR